MIYSNAGHLRILSGNEDRAVIEFGGERIQIHRGDEIWLLLDPYDGTAEGDINPTVITMSLGEFYKHESLAGNGEEFNDGYISGINVVHC